MSVKNYSPRLLDIYKLASEKEFIFNCKTKRKALALRHRLHALRREMRKENHWLTPVAEMVVIKIRGTNIIAQPPDKELDETLELELKKQGLKSDIQQRT